MRHAESTACALGQPKVIGVRLAVDDFGTGYSSLSYLTRFPIDTLKLDRSFVHNIIDSSDAAIVVSALNTMGNTLKDSDIGERVETQAHMSFLHDNGCEERQVYYFSRPVVAQQFAKL